MTDNEQTTDDMLELLESLDQEAREQAASSSATTSAAKRGDDDIMGFLDSLTVDSDVKSSQEINNESKAESEPEKEAFKPIEPKVVKTESEPIEPEPAKSEPVKPEPIKPEPIKPEPIKPVLNESPECDAEVSAVTEVEAEIAKSASHPPVEPVESQKIESPEANSLEDPVATLSSWWSRSKGGFWDSATSAVKQAEAKLQEIQHLDLDNRAKSTLHSASKMVNEVDSGISQFLFHPDDNENEKTGNGDHNPSGANYTEKSLTGLFNTVLQTIAPPIERHEQLRIHICHDMVGYRGIDTHVYNVFHKVMDQVEGGGEMTMVVQKGQQRHRRGSDTRSGWGGARGREMGIFVGTLASGKKLAKANLDEYIKTANAQLNNHLQRVNDDNKDDENSPTALVRHSNIFISLQPCSIVDSDEFFFIVHLADPEHSIAIVGQSQPFPMAWANWLDATDEAFRQVDFDPREWVIDWVEDGLKLAVGVCAQKYVIDRMGLE